MMNLKHTPQPIRRALLVSGMLMMIVSLSLAQGSSVRFHSLNPYRLTPSDVWNLEISYAGSAERTVRFEASVRGTNMQAVMSMESEQQKLKPGINLFSAYQVRQTAQRFFDQSIQQAVEQTGQYPAGTYQLCVSIIAMDGEPMGNYCEQVQIQVTSPPVAVQPSAGGLPTGAPVIFSWLPPGPGTGAGLSYDIALVELMPNQSPAEALSENPPLYFTSGIDGEFHMLPIEANLAKSGKTYAWQVTAKSGNTPVSHSPPAVFEVTPPESAQKAESTTQSYIDIRKQSSNMDYRAVGKVRIRHEEKAPKGQINYFIFQEDGKDLTPKRNKLSTHNGVNQLQINLLEIKRLKHEEFYLLKLTGQGDRPWILRFQYIDPHKL